ncbi:MAG: DEAD/DEAH box helicase [Cellulomonadaceae bacterium]|nr:DEAD/DEAH box helicase [Cellulomonadaceae bacterium]
MDTPLDLFGAATATWFTESFSAPTEAQTGTWSAIANNHHALVVAPTGSGKTLAAFLWAIDRLHHEPVPAPNLRCRILYISPLKALAADVQRNLRAPLAGIRSEAHRAGRDVPPTTVGMRTGDTPASERRRFATKPPDILVTTPESLFLILTSAARAGLAGVETVIIDEIHAVAGTKRGAHMAVSLERLDALLVASGSQPAQRVGLSATVSPVEEVAAFLGGHRLPDDGGRPVTIVQPRSQKQWQIDVVVPVPDMAEPESAELESAAAPGNREAAGSTTNQPTEALTNNPTPSQSMWPHVEERMVDLITAHTSTLVFTNSRRQAERLTSKINEIWARRNGVDVHDPGAVWPAYEPGGSGTASGIPQGTEILAMAHHGSMSRAARTHTETELKAGRLPAVVATSSLELGIDMGAVDLVIQVGAPPTVASGLQRVGRAGHQVGAVSHGVMFPTHRGDLVATTVVAKRMREAKIEALRVPRTPLDVLAQQVIAALAVQEWQAEDLKNLIRNAHPFVHLGEATWTALLEMLAGKYPSEEFGDLRPRIVWNRDTGALTARPGALRLAVTSGGTIPDRGMYGVFLTGNANTPALDPGVKERGGKRVGELDEEMVYETRVGDTITLGSSTWRVREITSDRVLVTPAPGLPGRLPFWKGEAQGRPAELGRAFGAFVREVDTSLQANPDAGMEQLRAAGLDDWAADNLAHYLADQRESTGRVPDDHTIVVERFHDELGDWRVVIHSPFGGRVHAPWALAIAGGVRDRLGLDISASPFDDGIVLRLPDLATSWDGPTANAPPLTGADLVLEADEVATVVRAELGSSVMFAARFREAAARALILPRTRPDKRQPLWQQRQRSAQLLQMAARHPDFPIMLEAARECLQDEFDIDALTAVMGDLATGQIQMVEVATPQPSPFARSLLMGYNASFLYNDDAPLAERKAAALALDPELLAELLGDQGAATIAELLDPEAVERTEAELGCVAESRQARDAEGLWDVLRRTGPHGFEELQRRVRADHRAEVADWLEALLGDQRVICVSLAGVDHWAVAEDAGRLRDALGVALPSGIPDAFLTNEPEALDALVRRHLRTHGPVTAASIATRFGLGTSVVMQGLARLEESRMVVRGALRPLSLGGTGDEWCDAEVLRILRRRSFAALRAEVESVDPPTLGIFLPRWQGVGTGVLRGIDGVLRVVEQLSGAVVPASALETLILPSRVGDYRPEMLDELTTTGEVLWCGHSRVSGSGGGDGMVSLHLAESAPLTLRVPCEMEADSAAAKVLEILQGSGGFFLPRIAELAGLTVAEALDAVWDLVWAGWVTNDSLTPLREAVSGAGAHRAPKAAARARPVRFRAGRLNAGRLNAGSLSAGRLSAGRLSAGNLSGPALASAATGDGGMGAGSMRTGGGRWSVLPGRDLNPTLRMHELAQILLDRHGVVTRALGPSEGIATEFSEVYRVLRQLEERGAIRRGYFVEHLGGSQFALPGVVDQLRDDAAERARLCDERVSGARWGGAEGHAVLLAATDPANPYGAALPWPGLSEHRPGRKAGAVVVLVNGDLVLFMERGGKTVLSFGSELTDDALQGAETPGDVLLGDALTGDALSGDALSVSDPASLQAVHLREAARILAETAREGKLGKVIIKKVDGKPAFTAVAEKNSVAVALQSAGFVVTPQGLRVGGFNQFSAV